MTVMLASRGRLLCPHCKLPTRDAGAATCRACGRIVPSGDDAPAGAASRPGAAGGQGTRRAPARRTSSLWRVLAVAWLGGVASPTLADEATLPDRLIERPTDASTVASAGGPAHPRQ